MIKLYCWKYLVTRHRKLKLKLTWEHLSCWLNFIVLECAPLRQKSPQWTYPVCTLHATTLTCQTRFIHRYNSDMTLQRYTTALDLRPTPQKIHTWYYNLVKALCLEGSLKQGISYFSFTKWTCQTAFKNIYVYSHRSVLVAQLWSEKLLFAVAVNKEAHSWPKSWDSYMLSSKWYIYVNPLKTQRTSQKREQKVW